MILQSVYGRMGIQGKLSIILLIFMMNSADLLANKSFYNRQPQISCRYLRHVYRFLWYKPQCNPDGSMKNPQCFHRSHLLKVCCCTYEKPLVNMAVRWIGQCASYKAKSKAMPICNGPKMKKKFGYYKDDKKVKEKAAYNGGQKNSKKDQGTVRKNDDQGDQQ